MNRREFVRRFVAVRSCTGCDAVLDIEHFDGAFCEECGLKFSAALNVGCKSCLRPARECECMPKALKKAGVLVHRKLYFYERENHASPEMRLIFRMKEMGSRRLSSFCAEKLAPLVLDELDTLGADRETLMITGVPRAEKNRRVYGFDHTERIARAISEKLGIKYERTFRTSFFAEEQKTLDANKRVKNAEKNIRPLRDVDVEGKYVILIDDMVTTGASMATCIEYLSDNGARAVLCFSLATKNKM